MTEDPFGVSKRYELNNNAPAKDKRRLVAANVAGITAAGTGGVIYGLKAGDFAERHNFNTGDDSAKGMTRSLAHGYKRAARTKQGKIGLGVAGAGVASNAVVGHRAKKKGTVIRVNKSDPFEVEDEITKAFNMAGPKRALAGAKMGMKGKTVSQPGPAKMGNNFGLGANKTMGSIKPAVASTKAALTPLAAATNRLKKPLAAGAAAGGAGGFMAGRHKQS